MAFQRSESPTAPLSPAGPDEFRHAGFCHEAIEGRALLLCTQRNNSAPTAQRHKATSSLTATGLLIPMRALREFRRTPSSAVLLKNGRRDSTRDVQSLDEADADELELQQRQGSSGEEGEAKTALDETLSKIGFGTYQKKLL